MTELEQILKSYWKADSFRPLQQEIISAILSRQDTIALLPTGGGKSVCYQVPALVNDGVCLVISPLISLMQDQVSKLKEKDIPAACLHSGLHYKEIELLLQNLVHGAYKLLYIAPERLQTSLFKTYLRELDVSLIAVDEAHCISQWGHDFRPDYLKIASLRESFPGVPVLALTATATPEVVKDIVHHLELKKPEVFQQGFRRANIFYEVSYCDNKPGAALHALRQSNGSCIVYCRSRKQTELLAKMLHEEGMAAVAYHAGMTREKRLDASESWMNNKAKVIVATTAFGMGIDKADVRLVLHYDMPEHPEAYYQETGRAGRDGLPARALALYNQADLKKLRLSTATRFPPEDYLRKVYQAVCEYLQVPATAEPDYVFPFDLADFCRKFGLQAVPAGHALKLLEQEGLWTLTDAVFRPATAAFKAERQTIDQLARTHPNHAYLCTTLLRQHGTIYNYPTIIRISAIARAARMKQDDVISYLEQLDKMGILEYTPAREGANLFFHHRRVHSEHLLLNRERISGLRKKHEERTEAIIRFFTNDHYCRERYVLQYFGETTTANCGHCDVCNRSITQHKDLKHTILSALRETGSRSLEELLTALAGFDREAVLQDTRSLLEDEVIDRDQHGKLFLKSG